MEAMVRFFKGLGDSSRLRIFNLLLNYTFLSVSDLEKMLQLSQTNVSRHLTVLKNSKLVINRRSGNYMIYQISNNVSNSFMFEFKKMAQEHIQFQSDLKMAQEMLPLNKK